MSVIKASNHNPSVQRVAFNFDDMTQRAEEYLAQIRAKGKEILAEAQKEAAEIRKRSETEGKQSAQKSIEQQVSQRAEEQLQQQLAALQPVMQQIGQALEDERHAWLAHWQQSAVQLAAAIAARVIRRELSNSPEIPVALVREALEMAAGSPHIRVHLHPDDHTAVGKSIEQVLTGMSNTAPAKLVPDENIERGGCRIETQHGVIDQQFAAQLKRIEEELLS